MNFSFLTEVHFLWEKIESLCHIGRFVRGCAGFSLTVGKYPKNDLPLTLIAVQITSKSFQAARSL
jgi:hypothetical protein